MADPHVAVVVPLHNAAPWIGATLKSVAGSIGLSPGDVEIVVVDDHSTDGGPELARKYLKRGPFLGRLISSGSSTGAAAARNTGWMAARAPWIQFLDADDLLAPHKLRLHLDAIRVNHDAAVLYSRWAMLYNQGTAWQVAADRDSRLGADPCCDLLRSDVFLQIGCALVAKEALDSVGGFDQSRTPVEDVDLLQRIALQGGRFVHVDTNQPTVLYRQVPDSLSRRDPRQFALGCLAKAETADDHFRATGEMTEERRKRLADAYFFCARVLAPLDAVEFERAVSRIEALEGDVLPAGPAALRYLSRLVGYRRAEQASIHYRRWKSRLRPSRP